ncbi:ABC transporter ATP-binding protein [Hamadaea tsunoensis]|uniref:ABC transporter ATP-binding protein n=1 Tax=Hamadaea tsunoensis TaxID=53368 RepID=UPI0003FED988|nr:ABC transporter ATP-binding protein [Hamadaea tsunoensis]
MTVPTQPTGGHAGDLELSAVTKRFGAFTAVDQLSLTVPEGSFFALLGASGCGKTTTLRMVAGLEEPTAGTVVLGGRDITRVRPYARPVNTVFQSYALFPHMTIAENVGFGLKQKRVGRKEIADRVREMLALVELTGFDHRRPAQLSGGQQQRVALARALINRPQVLLLDEPLGALDLKLRRQMQIELKRIQTEVGITFVHVTHDQEEAMTMADTVAVMNAGRIEQLGAPTEIYEFPTTAFVANFLGQSNLLTASVTGANGGDVLVEAYGKRFAVPAGRCRVSDGSAYLGVRPEKLHVAVDSATVPGSHIHVPGEITDSSYVGVSTQYLVRAPWGEELSVFAPNSGTEGPLQPGAHVSLHWHPSHSFLLARDNEVAEPVLEAA